MADFRKGHQPDVSFQVKEANSETGAMATKLFCSLSIFILLFDIILVVIQDTASSHTFLLVFFVMVRCIHFYFNFGTLLASTLLTTFSNTERCHFETTLYIR